MNATLRDARATGLLYLGLGLFGVLGSLLVRPRLIADDPTTTLTRLAEDEPLARLLIALELGTVVAQALVALWFFRLFRHVDAFAAGAITAFGLVNAIAILASAATLASALDLALSPAGDATAGIQLLTSLSANLWGVGAVFFGLWLLPMGHLVLRTPGMPRLLGRVLLVGGAGYVLSAFLGYLAPALETPAVLLTIPATIGELWMIGYLLHGGTFRRPAERRNEPASVSP